MYVRRERETPGLADTVSVISVALELCFPALNTQKTTRPPKTRKRPFQNKLPQAQQPVPLNAHELWL